MLTLKSLRRGSVALLLAIIATLPVHADTVASLLGDFTVNQFCGLQLGNQQVKLHYVVVFGQLPALRELHRADANDDGVTTQAERDAYIRKLAPGLAQQLKLSADGKPLELKLKSWTSSLPKEAAGFSLRLDADYVAALPASVTASPLHLKFANQTYSGNIGWHEIRVQVAQNIAVFDTNAYSDSLTEGLSINPKVLPPGGPLDERTIHLAFVHGPLPAAAKALALRPGTENGAQTVTAGAGGDSGVTTGSITGGGVMAALGLGNTWLARQTKRLVDAISGPHVPAHIMLLALLAALVLGALHAFSPGHGKTVGRRLPNRFTRHTTPCRLSRPDRHHHPHAGRISAGICHLVRLALCGTGATVSDPQPDFRPAGGRHRPGAVNPATDRYRQKKP